MNIKVDSFKRSFDYSQSNSIFFSICSSEKDGIVYLGSSDFNVYEMNYNNPNRKTEKLYAHESFVSSILRSGNLLISGGYDGSIIWWSISAKKMIKTVKSAHQKWIRSLAKHPKSPIIASVSDDMLCKIWDADSGKQIQVLSGHDQKTPHHFPSMLFTCCFSPSGKYLATADKIGKIMIWDTQTWKIVKSIHAPEFYTWDPTARRHSIGGIRSLAFSTDEDYLAIGGIGHIGNIDHLDGPSQVQLFDFKTSKLVIKWLNDQNKGIINYLHFSNNNQLLIAAGGNNDGILEYFDIKQKKSAYREKLGFHVHDGLWMEKEKETSLILAGHHHVSMYRQA